MGRQAGAYFFAAGGLELRRNFLTIGGGDHVAVDHLSYPMINWTDVRIGRLMSILRPDSGIAPAN